jgi:WD40 repeat protein
MRRWSIARAAAILAFCPVAAIHAHHSFSAEFDRSKPIELTGTITKVEWTNPHARIYIDVQGEDGTVVNWDFELGPPNGLMRQGWNRNSLRQGHVVRISGFLSKDQEHVANARSVFLPDGRQVLTGSSFDVDSPAPAQ